MKLEDTLNDESLRRAAFPVVEQGIYFGHAGVSPLAATARDALMDFARQSSLACQENSATSERVKQARRLAAELIGAQASEIALLGPTTLGINLVAHGLDWRAGDQVVFYEKDYPANVYAWKELARRGVEPISVEPDALGAIDWRTIEAKLTDRTRLVSLASCHFVSGWRIDVEDIGRRLHKRGILFSLDAIQTAGAFAIDVANVDFLSADSHKWLLGPCGAGIFYVAKEHHDRLRPALLGSWNVVSPDFIAQDDIDFYAGARRYEPGSLNLPGIVAMAASMKLLLDIGIECIAERLIALRSRLVDALAEHGYRLYLDGRVDLIPHSARSGIVSFIHDKADLKRVFDRLTQAGVTASLRHDPDGRPVLRFSPHFYNTFDEVDRVAELAKP